MKKLGQIREQYDLITEKEEAESRKLATLVRAGLFDSKKLPMLKRALSKDAKDMTPAERKILIELLDSLMAEVLQSQQIYSKVKQNVMMKEDFEFEMARTELKTLINDAKKILNMLKGEGDLEAWVQSKITKAADYISAAADNIEHSEDTVNEAVGKTFNGYYSKVDPRYQKMPTEREIPTIIILKRKAIRIYPDNQKVALYYSQALDKYVTIPFGTFDGGSVNEEIETDEDDPYIVKSSYTKYKNKKDAENLAKMKGSLDAMKRKMAAGGYKEGKSKKAADDTIKARAAALTIAIDKAPKETVTKKVDLSKKNPSELSKGNFDRLMQGISKDSEMNLATKIGAKVGLKARRAYDKGVSGAKKVDTAFEETETKSKFFAKREAQRLDELAPAVVAGAIAARAAAPHVARMLGNALARGRVATPKGPTVPAPKPTTPAPKPAEPAPAPKPSEPAPKPAEPAPAPKPSEPAPKTAEPKTQTKPETKPEAKPDAKTEPAPATTPAPKSQGGRGRNNLRRRIGAGAAAGLLGGLLGNVPRNPSIPQPFSLRATTSKPVGNVRTGVDARDTSVYRKAMQQNESVLKELYSIKENEEKTLNIANESVIINNTVAKKVISVYESLNASNKKKVESMLNESVDSFKKVLSFVARQ